MASRDRTRAFTKDVTRLVVKVGTAVVTRPDGRLAVGRIGALCEQLKELNSRGYEIVLVSSGAVGLGGQRLRYRRLINSSFADLQNPQFEFDGKACAAVGQNCLMALYDTMFSQLDVTSSQLLVTDSDFRNGQFRKQLSETVDSLLNLRVIPIFNENDAVSTRNAPYMDSSGIFWDNDSLAGLLALELKADLLVLLSDVDGLYSGPPSDPNSKLIHTYIKQIHQGEITFGDKSKLGRGGMTAKVSSAVCASNAGIPVVITSGYATDHIIEVLKGERIGTLFHRDAYLWSSIKDIGGREMAVAAREASRSLQSIQSPDRKKILRKIADALEANESLIMLENEADVADAELSGYERSSISRLKLKPGKISALANSIRVIAEMEDPIGCVLKRTELADGLVLEKTSCPLGVLLVVFDSHPDALVQIVSLAIRSGNGLLLKGGKEGSRSNAILHKVITSVLPNTVGERLIGLVTSREEIPDLLKLDDVIDLVIPRGSYKLVSQIKEATKIPVLDHADGICHVFIDKSAEIDMAKNIVLDAKIDYPAACNAMETLLVHKDLSCNGGLNELVEELRREEKEAGHGSLSQSGLNELVEELRREGVTLYGGPRASTLLNLAEACSFHHEYSSMACTVEIVDDVFAAIYHILEHGSAHTDCIVTEDREAAEIFLQQVDSAAVFHNASTRFCDGARFGLGAEVGISTSKIHARGPVGVEGLLTTRWVFRGNGKVVDGDKGVIFTHRDLAIQT